MALVTPVSPPPLVYGELRPGKSFPVRQLEVVTVSTAGRSVWRRQPARPANAMEPQRKHEFIPERSAAAATEAAVEEEKKIGNGSYEELATEMEHASPLAIMDKALEMFGNEIAIAFSGAEDVALLEYARLTGRPFRVFSIDTGRLNPETYQFFDAVEKHYGIHIEYMFPDSVEVQALVRSKGLFSFYEDGHLECCGVRKVRPLRRVLKGFRAWITGQRRDQSPCTRSYIPIVQIDPFFEGLEGGEGSLIKWNPVANINGKDIWKFLGTFDVPVNSLHLQGYGSIGCEPCTRPIFPGQDEREGRWWWEGAEAKECGLHTCHLPEKASQNIVINGSNDESDIFITHAISSLTRLGIENLLQAKPKKEPWLVVLYAPWCRFCHAMEASFVELAEKLNGSRVKVGKFHADGDEKPFSTKELQLGSFPTILFFPIHALKPVKYPSKRWDAASLLAFVDALS